MTITVLCPACDRKLTAPPSAAGRKVRCPKCQAMMLIPADEAADDFEVLEDDFEVVEEEPAPSRSASTRSSRSGARDDEPPRNLPKKRIANYDDHDDRPRRSRYDDDDDYDDDDYDNRPRKKKRKKKAAPSMQVPLIIGGCVLGVLLLALIAYFALSGSRTPANTNWVKFDAPDGSFSTSFPDSAPQSGDFYDLVTKYAPASESAKAKQQLDGLRAMGININAWSCTAGRRRYTIAQMKFPEVMAKMVKPEDVVQGFQQGAKNGAKDTNEKFVFEKSVTVSGQPAKQMGVTNSNSSKSIQIMTVFFANGSLFMIIVDSQEMSENDAMVEAFVGKFEIKGGSGTPAPSAPAPAADPADAAPSDKTPPVNAPASPGASQRPKRPAPKR